MTKIFDRWELELDDVLAEVERWGDRIANLDFLERKPNTRTKFHLRLRTPIPAHHRLATVFISKLETLGVDVDAIHAALCHHLPTGMLLEIRNRKTKLCIEIEGTP